MREEEVDAGPRRPRRGEERLPALHIPRLYKAFRRVADQGPAVIDVMDLTIQTAEFFTLLGPSGAGKTAILRLIAGVDPAGPRTVIVCGGRDIGGLQPRQRPLNMVFGGEALFPHMTISENISFGLRMLDRPSEQTAARVCHLLALGRLMEQADRLPADLSDLQRLCVATLRAMAPEPALILLDDPIPSVDPRLLMDLRLELKRLQRATGIAVMLATRDHETALAISDRVGVVRHGRLEQIGTPREIYDAPATRFVASYVGEANLIDGPLLGKNAGTTAIVRPERIRLVARDAPRIRAHGTIVSCSFLGADTLYEVSIKKEVLLRIRVRGGPDLALGEEVAVDWAEYAQHVVRA